MQQIRYEDEEVIMKPAFDNRVNRQFFLLLILLFQAETIYGTSFLASSIMQSSDKHCYEKRLIQEEKKRGRK